MKNIIVFIGKRNYDSKVSIVKGNLKSLKSYKPSHIRQVVHLIQ